MATSKEILDAAAKNAACIMGLEAENERLRKKYERVGKAAASLVDANNKLNDRLVKAENERDWFKRKMQETANRPDKAEDVLAVIHGDGGHYITKHGHEKASKDVMKIVVETRGKLDEAIEENERLRAALEQVELTLRTHHSTRKGIITICNGIWKALKGK